MAPIVASVFTWPVASILALCACVSVTFGQKGPESCAAEDAVPVPLGCARTAADSAIAADDTCVVAATGAATDGMPGFTPFTVLAKDAHPVAHCEAATQHTVDTAAVDQTDIKYLVTMAAFHYTVASMPAAPGASYPTLVVKLSNGRRVTVGFFIPNANTVVQPTPSNVGKTPYQQTIPASDVLPGVIGPTKLQYPFSGTAFCKGAFGYQVWDLRPLLAGLAPGITISTVTVVDPGATLRLHAMTLDKCAARYVDRLPALVPGDEGKMSDAYGAFSPTAVRSATEFWQGDITQRGNVAVPHGPRCARFCRDARETAAQAARGEGRSSTEVAAAGDNACRVFAVSDGGNCVTMRGPGGVELDNGVETDISRRGFVGLPVAGASIHAGAPATMPAPGAVKSVSDLINFGASAVPMASLFFPRFKSSSLTPIRLRFNTLEAYALSVATIEYTAESGRRITAFTAPDRLTADSTGKGTMLSCGGGDLHGGGGRRICDEYDYCPPVQLATAGGITDVELTVIPSSYNRSETPCATHADLTSGTVVHYRGSLASAPRYSHVMFRETNAADAAVAGVVEWHGIEGTAEAAAAKVRRGRMTQFNRAAGEHVPTPDAFAFAFDLDLGSSPPTSAPSWRWTDTNGLLRSAPILCELSATPGFAITRGFPGLSTATFDCDVHGNSIAAAAKACDANPSCIGFSTLRDGGDVEAVKCLLNAVGDGTADAAATLYTKTSHTDTGRLRCSMTPDGAAKVRVRVSAADATAVVRISADGVEIGNCDVSTLVFDASIPSPCGRFAECAAAAPIPAGATAVTVDFDTVGPRVENCAHHTAAAIVDFSSTDVWFTLPAACTDELTGPTGCEASVPVARASCTARLLAEVDLPTTGCSLADDPQSTAQYTVPSATGTAPVAATALIVTVDLSAMAAADRQGLGTTVVGVSPTGQHVLLGNIFTAAESDALRFAPAHRAWRAGEPLCTNDPSTLKTVDFAAVFPLPAALRAVGLAAVHIRGAKLIIAHVALLRGAPVTGGSCPAYPMPLRLDADQAFAGRVDRILPTGTKLTEGLAEATDDVKALNARDAPAIALAAAAKDWGACADACNAAYSCRVWEFRRDISCVLYGGIGVGLGYGAAQGSGADAGGAQNEPLANVASSSAIGIRQMAVRLSTLSSLPALPVLGTAGTLSAALRTGAPDGGAYPADSVFVLPMGNGRVSLELGVGIDADPSGQSGVHVAVNYPAGAVAIAGPDGSAATVCGRSADSPWIVPSTGAPAAPSEAVCRQLVSCPQLGSTGGAWEGSLRIQPDSGLLRPFVARGQSAPVRDTTSWPCQPFAVVATPSAAGARLSTVMYSAARREKTMTSAAQEALGKASRTAVASTVETLVIDDSAAPITRITLRGSRSVGDVPVIGSGPFGSGVLCDVSEARAFRPQLDRDGSADFAYACNSVPSIDAAIHACDTNPNCRGFSVGLNDKPKCFFTSTSGAAASSGTTLFAIPSTVTCKVKVAVTGTLRVATTQLGLGAGSGTEAVIRMNGQVVRRCGDIQPFASGLSAVDVVQCASFRSCMNDVVLLPNAEVTVELPTPSRRACGFSHRVFFELTPVASSFYERIAELPMTRQIRLRSSGRPVVELSGYRIRRAVVVMEQDRYACFGKCESQIGDHAVLKIDGVQVARCGGASDFNEGDGRSDLCNTYYSCGLPTTVAKDPGAAKQKVELLITHPDADRSQCHSVNELRATIYTDGLLLGANDGQVRHRVVFGLLVKPENLPSDVTFVGDAVSTIPIPAGLDFDRLHKAQYPWIDAPVIVERLIEVRVGTEERPSFGLIPIDDPTLSLSQRMVRTDQYAMCILDQVLDSAEAPSCEVAVETEWVDVLVAQTAFTQNSQTVTVDLGDGNQFTCGGGDKPFYGLSGQSGECSTYLRCYSGPARRKHVSVTFTQQVLNTDCEYKAMVIITPLNREVPKQQGCTGTAPFECAPLGTCMATAQLCNGEVECPNGLDEARCNSWSFAVAGKVPQCASGHETVAVTGSTECMRIALAHAANAYVLEGGGCTIYDCLSFQSPKLVTKASAALYIQASDASLFKYCTDSLHCNNNGRVASTEPPCSCTCDTQYTGATCSSLRDISLIDSVYVVFPPYGVNTSDAISATERAVATQSDQSTSVSVTSVRRSAQSVAVELAVFNTHTGRRSEHLQRLLGESVSSAIIRELKRFDALFVTASSVVGNMAQMDCNFANLSSTINSCTQLTPEVGELDSVSITFPAITFGDADQWVDIEVYSQPATAARRAAEVDLSTMEKSATFRCASTDFVQSLDATQSGACATVSKCVKVAGTPMQAAAVRITLSPKINPTLQRCNSHLIAESRTIVLGAVGMPADDRNSESTSSITAPGTVLLLGLFLGALGLLSIAQFFLWLVWMRKRFHHPLVAYVGPLTIILGIVLLIAAALVGGLYLEATELHHSHELLMEEYRDRNCNASEFAPIPFRVSKISIDGNCHHSEVIGAARGAAYLSAVVPNGTRDVAQARRGGTSASCQTGLYKALPLERCIPLREVFPDSDESDSLFVSLKAMPKETTAARIAALRKFNPPIVLPANTSVQSLAASLKYLSQPGKLTYSTKEQPGITRTLPVVQGDSSTHFSVVLASAVSKEVRENSTHRQRVRFVSTFRTSRTMFKKASETYIDEAPLPDQGLDSTMPNIGTFYNGYPTSSAIRTYRGALSFSGIKGSEADLSRFPDGWTTTFWISAQQSSRGVIFAVADNWRTKAGEYPAVSRMINQIENTNYTQPWFTREAWRIYSATYVDGRSGTVVFAYTGADTGRLYHFTWDANKLGFSRLFDGGWHFVSMQMFWAESNRVLQLFIDGETSFSNPGWRHCLKEPLSPIRSLSAEETVIIFNPREESVRTDGQLIMGHLNAGLWNLNFQSTPLVLEQVLARGSSGMGLYASIARSESMMLGLGTLLLTAIMALVTAYQVWHHFFGVDADELYAERIQRQRRLEAEQAAHGTSDGADQATENKSHSRSLFVQYLIPIVITSQNFTLYFSGWNWPKKYTESFGLFYSLISFDLFNIFPNAPMMIFPLIQAVFGLSTMLAFLFMGIADDDTLVERTLPAYRNRNAYIDRTAMRRAELDRARPKYQWVIFDDNSKPQPLDEAQSDFLQRGLHDLLTSTRKSANMRLYSREILSFPGIGNGILLYERRDGHIGIHFRMPRDQDLVLHAASNELHADRIHVTQLTLESRSENVACPLHHRRLLRTDLEGMSCVHNDAEYYRSVSCDAGAVMYKCPDPECMYAVCEDCWKHGGSAIDAAASGFVSSLADIRKKGVWRFLFRMVIVAAALSYVPVLKNALFILVCHPSFQCEFGGCWSELRLKFVFSVVLALIVIAFIGIGLIVMEAWFLWVRKERLDQELPRTELIKKRMFRFLPTAVVKRHDWDEFLEHDITMLRTLYEAYDYGWMWFWPVHLLIRFLVIITVITSTPNSLTQLAAVIVIEMLSSWLVMLASPYKQIWVEVTVRLTNMHQLVQLGVYALHRVDLRNKPDEGGFVNQMIIANSVYFVAIFATFILLLVAPFVRDYCCRDRIDDAVRGELDAGDVAK